MQNTDTIQEFIDSLFAKNRALYGDARMEGEPGSETPPEGEPSGQQSSEQPEQQEQSPSDPPEGTPKEDDLPEHWRGELGKARSEAAKYRTSLREAEAKLAEAKTPEDIAAAVKEFQDRNAVLERELLVTKVASSHGLPAELAELLKGDDEKALTEHAKKLALFIPRADPDLSGGLTPGSKDDGPDNPRELAKLAGGRRSY